MGSYKDEQHKTREALKPKFTKSPGKHVAQVGQGLGLVNRAAARKRVIDRTYTKKGYAFGRKMNTPEDRAIERIAKRQA